MPRSLLRVDHLLGDKRLWIVSTFPEFRKRGSSISTLASANSPRGKAMLISVDAQSIN
jgi:hypothetical protein